MATDFMGHSQLGSCEVKCFFSVCCSLKRFGFARPINELLFTAFCVFEESASAVSLQATIKSTSFCFPEVIKTVCFVNHFVYKISWFPFLCFKRYLLKFS